MSGDNSRWITHIVRAAFLLAILWATPAAQAQLPLGMQGGAQAAAAVVPEPVDPRDELRRDTPRSSMDAFLLVVDEGDFEKAAQYLDLRGLPDNVRRIGGATLAMQLEFVLQRAGWVELESLSNKPEGRGADGLPAYRDLATTIDTGKHEVPLYMQRVPDGEDKLVWKVSHASVARVPELYSEFAQNPFVAAIAEQLPASSFMGTELYQWVIVIAAALLTLPFVWGVALLVLRATTPKTSPIYPRVRRFLTVPMTLFVLLMMMNQILVDLGMGAEARDVADARPLTLLMVVWVLISGTNLIRDYYGTLLERQGKQAARMLLRPASNFLKGLIILVTFIFWLDNMGVNISTLLAGLGVGGIAIALALQKPLEDFFGAISLFTLQPIRVGDFCRVGTVLGTVEEISLRTTRIRTRNNTLVTISNSKFSAEDIDNYSFRQKIWYHPTMRAGYDTPADQLDQLLQGIRMLLQNHDRVEEGTHRAQFMRFGTDALELEVFAYVTTTVYAEYLEVAEDLNFQILRLFDALGVKLVPATHRVQLETVSEPSINTPE
jgi:MscS family membrane protein